MKKENITICKFAFKRLNTGQSKFILQLSALLLFGLFSCKKSVEVNPPNASLDGASIFTDNTTAAAAVAGIFQKISSNDDFYGPASTGSGNYTSIMGLSADEFQLFSGNTNVLLSQAYTNSLSSTKVPFWSSFYNCLYTANTAIDGLNNSTTITASLKTQLLGEATFARAFSLFYLVNTFGSVPLVTTSNYVTNNTIARTDSAQVYKQIIADLKNAQAELSPNFLSPTGVSTTERTLPNQGSASALLARVYLYTNDWADAAAEATSVINNSNFSLVSALNKVFLKNSTEAIWQLPPVNAGYNTPDGYAFILTSTASAASPIYLSQQLLNSFEAGDARKLNWVGTYQSYNFAYKYQVKGGPAATAVTEYYMVLRLAEQYLIRAEAQANGAGNGIPGAINDLNVIRNRAGLPNYTGAIDKASVIKAILHERQVELFAEWGHRWLDLKRTGNVNLVMSVITSQKGGTWNANAHLFPIPIADIQIDPNLTQNPGYN